MPPFAVHAEKYIFPFVWVFVKWTQNREKMQEQPKKETTISCMHWMWIARLEEDAFGLHKLHAHSSTHHSHRFIVRERLFCFGCCVCIRRRIVSHSIHLLRFILVVFVCRSSGARCTHAKRTEKLFSTHKYRETKNDQTENLRGIFVVVVVRVAGDSSMEPDNYSLHVKILLCCLPLLSNSKDTKWSEWAENRSFPTRWKAHTCACSWALHIHASVCTVHPFRIHGI